MPWLRRGEPLDVETQRRDVRVAADHAVVVTHGNGPQVGLLAPPAPSSAAGEGGQGLSDQAADASADRLAGASLANSAATFVR
jgi:carbamate kinase